MKCVDGIWYHKGQSYSTLYAALAAAWPYALPEADRQKKSRPRYCEYRGRQGEKGLGNALYHL